MVTPMLSPCLLSNWVESSSDPETLLLFAFVGACEEGSVAFG